MASPSVISGPASGIIPAEVQMHLMFATHGLFEVLKDAGDRWITIHPNGPNEPGHPVLVKTDPHNPSVGRIVAGAGGKLNYTTVHLKSPEGYKREASEKRAKKQAAAASARFDPDGGAKKKKSLQALNENRQREEHARLGAIAERLGWGDADKVTTPDDAELRGLDPKTADRVKREHMQKLARDVRAAALAAKDLLVTDADARAQAGIGEVPLRADETHLGAAAFLPDTEISKARGYKPETSAVDDATVRADKVRALEGRMRDAAESGNPEDAARTAGRLARTRQIDPHEIDDASPTVLAGWARVVSQRYDRLTNYTAAAQIIKGKRGEQGPADPISEEERAELDHMSKLVEGAINEGINNASSGFGKKNFPTWLKLAHKHGLLDPAAAREIEQKAAALRYEEAGAPSPESLTPDALAKLDGRALDVLVAEAATRIRGDVSRTPAEREAAQQAQRAVAPTPGAGPAPADRQQEMGGVTNPGPRQDLREEALVAPEMGPEEKRAYLARALDLGVIGPEAKPKPTADDRDEKREARDTAITEGRTAAEVLALHEQLRSVRSSFRKKSQAIHRGEAVEGTEYDPEADVGPHARVARGGAVDLHIDPKATADLVQGIEDEIRTRAARSFLDEVHGAYESTEHLRPEDAQADRERHMSFGAADALNNHAQTILGGPVLDRQAIDTLGADGAAQVLAWAVHQAREHEADAIHGALGDYHAGTQVEQAEDAMGQSRESFDAANEIHQGMLAQETGDLADWHAKNQERIGHIHRAREALGRTLGALEATASLHRAMGRQPAESVRVSLGPTQTETVTRQLHAIGLGAEDYEIHDDGTNKWAEIKASGFPKLTRKIDPADVRLHADMEAIKRGDHDRAGYLPPNFANRSEAPPYIGPAAPMLEEPFDYGLTKHSDVKTAVEAYIGQRVNDGWSPAQINADLLRDEHRTAFDAAGPIEHPGVKAWEIANPAPPAKVKDWTGDETDNPDHAAWQNRRSAHAITLGPTPAGSSRHSEFVAATNELLPARHSDPKREGEARDDLARLDTASADPEQFSRLASKYRVMSPYARRKAALEEMAEEPGMADDLSHAAERAGVETEKRKPKDIAADILAMEHPNGEGFIHPTHVEDVRREIKATAAGERNPKMMAEHYGPILRAIAEDHIARDRGGDKTGALHHQEIDPQHTQDAAFRALARHPEATAAFKPTHELTHPEREALRLAFHRYHAMRDTESAPRPDEAMAAWRKNSPEPVIEQRDMFDTGPSMEEKHAAWKSRHDAAKTSAETAYNKGAEQQEVIDWPGYVRAHRGAHAAYAAVQDLVRGRFMQDFHGQYQGLSGKPLKSGTEPIRGWREHRHGMDPEFREWWKTERDKAQNALRERDTGGRYAEGAVRDRIDKRMENEGATSQQQVTSGIGDMPTAAPHGGPPEGHERMTLGENVEAHLADIVGAHADMIDPRKPFAARFGVHMDARLGDDKVHQQRAINAWGRAGRIGLFLGAGSGKTNVAFGAFGEARARGQAARGLYAVPSIVQEQFGGEALAFLRPGETRWWAKGGAPREERMAAYRDPNTHMVVTTHQSLRDDVTHMLAQHLDTPEADVTAKMTGYNADGEKHAGAWDEAQTDANVKAALQAHGADGLLDFLAIDEGHTALNRAGKQDSHLARVIDSLGRISKHVGYMTGSPVKNDASEIHDQLVKIAPDKYGPGADKIGRAEFMRRYGGDTTASAAALRRELAKHTYLGRIDPGTDASYHHETLAPSEPQRARLAEIERAYMDARRAKQRGDVDIDAVRRLSPGAFKDVPKDQHHDVAKRLSAALGMARDAAFNHAVNIHPEGAKLDRIAEIVKQRTAETGHDGKPKAGVVFARNMDAVEAIRARLEKDGHKVVTLTGKDAADKKAEAKDAFQGGHADVIVLSNAGATGANLHRGSYEIQHDIPQTYMTWDQRQARINRMDPTQKGGPPRKLDVHTLALDHAWEHANKACLERKEALHDALFDGAGERLDDTGLAHYLRERLRPEMNEAGEERAA